MISGSKVREIKRATVHSCREKIRKARAQLELTLAIVSAKKDFLSVSTARGDLRKTVGLILDEDRYLTNWNEEKAETSNALFALAFNINDSSWVAGPVSWRDTIHDYGSMICGHHKCKRIVASAQCS